MRQGLGLCHSFATYHIGQPALPSRLLLWLWRSFPSPGGEVSLHPAVIKALNLLGNGAWEGSLAALARQCGVSEAYLSRVFTRQMGVPLSRYRNSVRLGRFLEIRRGPVRKTITEAAYESGFGSYAQFYRVFAQSFGCGPGKA